MLWTRPQEVQVEGEAEEEEEVAVAEEGGQRKLLPTPQGVSLIVSKWPVLSSVFKFWVSCCLDPHALSRDH